MRGNFNKEKWFSIVWLLIYVFCFQTHQKTLVLRNNSQKLFSIAFLRWKLFGDTFLLYKFFPLFFSTKASQLAKETSLSRGGKKNTYVVDSEQPQAQGQTMSIHKTNPPPSRRPQTYNNLIKCAPKPRPLQILCKS